MIAHRAEQGKNYGVVLIPEGLVEYMHDVSTLIAGKWTGWGGTAPRQPKQIPARVPLVCLPASLCCSAELNELLAQGLDAADQAGITARLTPESEDVSWGASAPRKMHTAASL